MPATITVSGGGGFTPIPSDIPAGTTYVVAAGTQQVAHGPITVEGTLTVNGRLWIV